MKKPSTPWKPWRLAGTKDRPYQTIKTPPSEMELEQDELLGLAMRVERTHKHWQSKGVGERHYCEAKAELEVKKRQFLAKWRTP